MKFALKYLLSQYIRNPKDTILTIINFYLAALLIAFWSFYIFNASNGSQRGYKYYENAVFRCANAEYSLLYKELNKNKYSSPVSEITEFEVTFLLEEEIFRRGDILPTCYSVYTKCFVCEICEIAEQQHYLCLIMKNSKSYIQNI